MPFLVSNKGRSWRYVDEGHVAAEGEWLQDAEPAPPSPSHEWVDSAWVVSQRRQALAAISGAEEEQVRRVTARADREFRLAVYQALASLPGLGSLATHPAFLALKALDDAIKVERAKL